MTQKIFFNLLGLILSISSFGQKGTLAKFSNISIDKFGIIRWTVSYFQNESGFEILFEQLKDGKWYHNGGLGGSLISNSESLISNSEKTPAHHTTDNGSCQIKFHKGTTTYRLRMTFPNQIISNEFQLISQVSNDNDSLWIMENTIYLDKIDQYEILDKYGSTISKGEGKSIDIASLAKGPYFLYTKTATKRFIKD